MIVISLEIEEISNFGELGGREWKKFKHRDNVIEGERQVGTHPGGYFDLLVF